MSKISEFKNLLDKQFEEYKNGILIFPPEVLFDKAEDIALRQKIVETIDCLDDICENGGDDPLVNEMREDWETNSVTLLQYDGDILEYLCDEYKRFHTNAGLIDFMEKVSVKIAAN